MKVDISKSARLALLRSNKRVLLTRKIGELAADPTTLQANVVRLQGRSDFRLRVQDWRIIFRIENETLFIDEIGPRGSVYEDKP